MTDTTNNLPAKTNSNACQLIQNAWHQLKRNESRLGNSLGQLIYYCVQYHEEVGNIKGCSNTLANIILIDGNESRKKSANAFMCVSEQVFGLDLTEKAGRDESARITRKLKENVLWVVNYLVANGGLSSIQLTAKGVLQVKGEIAAPDKEEYEGVFIPIAPNAAVTVKDLRTLAVRRIKQEAESSGERVARKVEEASKRGSYSRKDVGTILPVVGSDSIDDIITAVRETFMYEDGEAALDGVERDKAKILIAQLIKAYGVADDIQGMLTKTA